MKKCKGFDGSSIASHPINISMHNTQQQTPCFFFQTELFYSYNKTPFIEFSYKSNKIKRERVFKKHRRPGR